MAIIRIKHIKRVRVKGRTYWYHRKTGERLPDDPEERALRAAEINRCLNGQRRTIAAGSVQAVITLYKAAPNFRSLAATTKKDYALYLDIINEKWGRLPIADIRKPHILAFRDQFADKPGKANGLLKSLRILLDFAVERELRTDNPAKDVKRLKGGKGHESWPDDAIDRFLASAPPMMALALRLGLYTGQREGDCLEMSWHDYNGKEIYVVQNKTGTKLRIPVHPELKAALDSEKRISPVILTAATGKPFKSSNFRFHFGTAVKAAGLVGVSFHGLRYTAAARLAEAECSLKEIAAITGHKSLAMIEKYTRDADQKRLAGAAILKLQNASGTKNGKLRC